MFDIVSHSLLPVLELIVSDNSITNVAEKIASWLKSTGGLYNSN